MNPPNSSHAQPGPDGDAWQLHRADAEALEALIDLGFDPARVPAPLRERAAHIAGVLGLIGAPVDRGTDGLLVDATLARVAQARRTTATHGFEPVALSPNDEDALELLVSAGFRAERVPASLRTRARKHAALLDLLGTQVEGGSRESLVRATLDRVQRTVDTQERRMRLDERPAIGRRIRLGDLISVAAVLLLAFSVVIPVLGSMREMSRRAACQSGMAQAGIGFSSYAADFRESLPLASASTPGQQWWWVGDREQSNSANLFTLTRANYTGIEDLACPGNPEACREKTQAGPYDWREFGQVSYSYQNMFASERPVWTGTMTITVISDRSPIIPLAMKKQRINPLQNSLQHGGTGQSVLQSDGSIKWLKTPVLASGDNMFLPRPLEELIARLQQLHEAAPLQGTETPAGADDVFLTP